MLQIEKDYTYKKNVFVFGSFKFIFNPIYCTVKKFEQTFNNVG